MNLNSYHPLDRRMLIEILKQANTHGSAVAISDSIDWGMKELIGAGALAEIEESMCFECRITEVGRGLLVGEALG